MTGINWGNNGFSTTVPPTNYVPQVTQFSTPLPHYEVIRVNGANGADAFQMGPNSSILLMDETAPIVWLVQTDGAGYKTKTPYDISIHEEGPSPEIKAMEEKFASINKRLKALEEVLSDEPND